MLVMYRVHVADMRFTLDQIEAINQNVTAELPAGHLDMQHVGLFGHSAGATTAAETCREDSRCQAALLIDGTLFRPAPEKPASIPAERPLPDDTFIRYQAW